jgi:hypothetical protein
LPSLGRAAIFSVIFCISYHSLPMNGMEGVMWIFVDGHSPEKRREPHPTLRHKHVIEQANKKVRSKIEISTVCMYMFWNCCMKAFHSKSMIRMRLSTQTRAPQYSQRPKYEHCSWGLQKGKTFHCSFIKRAFEQHDCSN